jgi:hypothetical protein
MMRSLPQPGAQVDDGGTTLATADRKVCLVSGCEAGWQALGYLMTVRVCKCAVWHCGAGGLGLQAFCTGMQRVA